MINLIKREKEIMDGLKDFQRETVERIFQLFKSGQTRILIADEVGLGKTLVAKGVIAKSALWHKEMNDDLFKVVYICSNQNIARQNITKLKIDPNVTVDRTDDTRLSMQHLKFFEQKHDENLLDNYIQLIPLTPATSFHVTGGSGIVQERALIYAIFRRIPFFAGYSEQLEFIFKNNTRAWDSWAKSWIEERVVKCDNVNKGAYLQSVIEKMEDALNSDFAQLKTGLLNICAELKRTGKTMSQPHQYIHQARQMMSQISLDFLEPDLVIMDEFQRFRHLISSDNTTESGMLVNRFLHSNSVKTLLLSATPYKLYSTLEEITESGGQDEHYDEFMEVINFLFDKDEVKCNQFRVAWSNFSLALKCICDEEWQSITQKKSTAEEIMFNGICRTERLMVSTPDKDLINTKKAKAIEITENDILSYIQADLIVEALWDRGSKVAPPIEYVKSAPFILSFMEHYQLKKELKRIFKSHPDIANILRKSNNSWIKKDTVKRYRKLVTTNARLEQLMKESFSENAERYLWVPPTLPYYDFGGPYKNPGNFSKILVFSAWEMVPRMIASLVSYEAERLTIGKMLERDDTPEEGSKSYFADNKQRYPRPRLSMNMKKNEKTGITEPGRMALFSILYPSITLARLFNPITALNNKPRRAGLDISLKEKISLLIDRVTEKYQATDKGTSDERWYWAAPVLLDLMFEPAYVNQWFEEIGIAPPGEDEADGQVPDEKEDRKLFNAHMAVLKDTYFCPDTLSLGRLPKDLVSILVLQTLGSPAVCALRMSLPDLTESTGKPIINGAQRIARAMLNKFNLPESTAIVELAYGTDTRKKTKKPDEAHWVNVLAYCADGNLQSVFDEYRHILLDGYNLRVASPEVRVTKLAELITDSLKTHTASYKVDTYNSFVSNAKRSEIRIRSHYAAGFYNSGREGKTVQRTEFLRHSFNSPFRPFVLATTSIGQEGLDFHFYCRKIFHWNLPANPVDLEQREGRINRFKGLVIRQNVASKYRNISFTKDLWEEMFDECKAREKKNHCELVPYWYLEPDNEDTASYIERIVPMYPLSRDNAQYDRLLKILSLYRITLGQARQEELLTFICNNLQETELYQLKQLFINLSPFYKKERHTLSDTTI
jgi:hypothetical protein